MTIIVHLCTIYVGYSRIIPCFLYSAWFTDFSIPRTPFNPFQAAVIASSAWPWPTASTPPPPPSPSASAWETSPSTSPGTTRSTCSRWRGRPWRHATSSLRLATAAWAGGRLRTWWSGRPCMAGWSWWSAGPIRGGNRWCTTWFIKTYLLWMERLENACN